MTMKPDVLQALIATAIDQPSERGGLSVIADYLEEHSDPRWTALRCWLSVQQYAVLHAWAPNIDWQIIGRYDASYPAVVLRLAGVAATRRMLTLCDTALAARRRWPGTWSWAAYSQTIASCLRAAELLATLGHGAYDGQAIAALLERCDAGQAAARHATADRSLATYGDVARCLCEVAYPVSCFRLLTRVRSAAFPVWLNTFGGATQYVGTVWPKEESA